MIRRILLAIVSILPMIPLVSAQPETLTLRHISQTKGLPNNHITELYKDSRGFLWIGSAAGLFRYDGYSTRKVTDMVGKRSGVLSEQILRIQEDALGRLWVQSESYHAIYDPVTNTLTDWISEFIKELGIDGFVTAVFSDENGDIWLSTQQDALYRIRIKENKSEKATGVSLTDKTICSLAMSGGKIIGVTTTGALLETDPATLKMRIISKGPYETEVDPSHHLIYADKSEGLWITNNERMFLYDLRSNSWQNILLPNQGYFGVVKKIYNDSKGNLWIARDHQGIEKLEYKDGKYEISPVATGGDFIPHSTVSAILEDENGTILFGTYKLGLYSYNESVNKFRTEGFPNLDRKPDVNCMTTTPDGSVWIGTDNYGLWKWHPKNNRYDHIPDATEVTPVAITALAASPDGDIYIGKFAKGLFKYQDGQVVPHKTDSEIDRSYVWSMDFDKNGVLWIGTLGNGVIKYDTKNGQSEHFTISNSKLKSDYIISILPSKDGNIYIGTSGGVCCYNAVSKSLTPVNIDDDPSLSDNKIMQIIEDTRGLIWISTTSGLKVLDGKKGKVYNIPNGDSTFGDDVLGIIEDNNGSIWVSNSSRLTNLKITYDEESGSLGVTRMEYDRQSGLPECDFNQRSFVKLQDGSIAVGDPFGIIHFNPNDIRRNVNKPKVIFTDLYMDNKPIDAGEKIDGRVALKKAIFSGERIELKGHLQIPVLKNLIMWGGDT